MEAEKIKEQFEIDADKLSEKYTNLLNEELTRILKVLKKRFPKRTFRFSDYGSIDLLIDCGDNRLYLGDDILASNSYWPQWAKDRMRVIFSDFLAFGKMYVELDIRSADPCVDVTV